MLLGLALATIAVAIEFVAADAGASVAAASLTSLRRS